SRTHVPDFPARGLCLSGLSIKIAQRGMGCLLYCRLVRCLVPTFSRTPEFPSTLRRAAIIPRRCIRTESRVNASAGAGGMSLGRRASREDELGAGRSSQLKITPEHYDEALLTAGTEVQADGL